MKAQDVLYDALRKPLGVIVRGDVKALRRARSEAKGDIAVSDLAILGPDGSGQVWVVRKDAIRGHLVSG